MCRDGKAYEMSADHKPEDEIELNRIKNAGGKVTPDGRVNGGLNLSRAIGNFYHSLSMINESMVPMPFQLLNPNKHGFCYQFKKHSGI